MPPALASHASFVVGGVNGKVAIEVFRLVGQAVVRRPLAAGEQAGRVVGPERWLAIRKRR